PAPKVVGLFSEWIFVLVVMDLIYMLLLFPTGTLPSRRWLPVAWFGIALTALSMIGFAVTPRQVALPAPGGVSLTFANPFGIRSLGPVPSALLLGTLPAITVLSVVLFAAAATALVVRYRSGGTDLRQQIKWVAFAAVTWAVFQAALALAQAVGGTESPATI